MKPRVGGVLFAVIICIAGCSFPAAAENVLDCSSVGVRSLTVSVEVVTTAPRNAIPETINVDTIGNTQQIVSRGPVLGSMDSPEISTDLVCDKNGITLRATITRSANYNGAVRQNENWWPKITVDLSHQPSDTVFQTIWEMRLTTGVKVTRAKTPAYPERVYPITVTKTIYSSRAQ